MKAQELRIGNIINMPFLGLYDGVVVEGIAKVYEKDSIFIQSKKLVGKNDQYFFETPEKYEPIHLTEEWLVKSGFKKQQTIDYCNRWYIGENPVTHDWLFSLVWLAGHLTPFFQNGYLQIKYVHQLQNLYFALTGEELSL